MFRYVLRQLFKAYLEDIHVYLNPVRKLFGAPPSPVIHFGRIGRWYRPYPFILGEQYLENHKHIIGLTGKGKSKLMADMACQLILQKRGVAVIDPHSDLATDMLIYLYQAGYFKRKDAFKKFLYIDFGRQDQRRSPTHFVPFNILNQSTDKYVVARGVVEAMKRVWPYLRDNAPHFENVLLYSLLVLIDNKKPITAMDRLLTDKSYRMKLLNTCTDEKVVNFFLYRYDSWKREQAKLRESTLNKVTLFTLPPALRYSLGHKDNILDFRRLMDEGVSMVFDLGGLDEETQRLLGCLLAVGFEEAALSRDAVMDRSNRRAYHLFLDEFDKFSAQSEVSLAHILAQTRKFQLYLTLAHQTISQTTERLLGALQNTATIAFRVGYLDAPKLAPRFCDHHPLRIKHQIENPQAQSRQHPLYYSPTDTHEVWERELANLWSRYAYIKLEKRVWKFKTKTFPRLRVGWETIDNLKRTYADLLMVKREAAKVVHQESEQKVVIERGKRMG